MAAWYNAAMAITRLSPAPVPVFVGRFRLKPAGGEPTDWFAGRHVYAKIREHIEAGRFARFYLERDDGERLEVHSIEVEYVAGERARAVSFLVDAHNVNGATLRTRHATRPNA